MNEHGRARGAIDLGSLAAPAAPAGSYVTEVDEANFESTLRQSARFPIVVEFYSPRDPGGAQLSADLAALADAAAGAWLLARVNVDAAGRIAASLQIRAVPTVVGVLGGQLVPLWQGTLAKDEAARYIAELLKVAAANGLMGKAQPVASASPDDPAADPRYEAAYSAMEQADWAGAAAEFAKLLQDNPADALAKAGQAQARLLGRVAADPAPETAALFADAHPDDVLAQLRAADYEVASGHPAAGFARLTAAVGRAAGPDRDTLRTRLLELFETMNPADPVVLKARRELAAALY